MKEAWKPGHPSCLDIILYQIKCSSKIRFRFLVWKIISLKNESLCVKNKEKGRAREKDRDRDERERDRDKKRDIYQSEFSSK